ncbi:putative oxidoreductase SSP0419 isoform X2 [Amblyomma americanum]
MPDLKGKVALITGASLGIGNGTAVHFASLGCWLSLTARNKEALEEVAAACVEQGLPRDKVLVVPGDVSVEEDVAAVVDKTVAHFGKIDVLVNNAAIAMNGSTDGAPMEDFERVWATNLRGPLCMIRSALPYLRESKGRRARNFATLRGPYGNIVNVSSIVAQAVIYNMVPYSLTKAALDHVTRCAALENAQHGVRVNAINTWSTSADKATPWGALGPRMRWHAASLSWRPKTPPSSRASRCPWMAACFSCPASRDRSPGNFQGRAVYASCTAKNRGERLGCR